MSYLRGQALRYVTNGGLGQVGPHGPAPDPELPLTIAHWRHADAEFDKGGGGFLDVVLVLSECQTVERLRGGVWSHRPSRVGNITVVDPEESTRFLIRGRAEVVKLFVPLALFAEAAGFERRSAVVARFGEPAAGLERCAHRALVALHEGEGADPLLLSSIALRLLVQTSGATAAPTGPAVGGLARRQLRRVRDFIEASVSAPVAKTPSLKELAAEANLSMYHFTREFHRTTGSTPYAYVLRRRLERARNLVLQTDVPLARVGALTGFQSPAHFADRFRREMGVAPGALRRAVRGEAASIYDSRMRA